MAFFDVLEGIHAFPNIKCELVVPWKTRFPSQLAMAVPKNSPYFEVRLCVWFHSCIT